MTLGGSKQFPAFFNTSTLTNKYYDCLSVNVAIMVSNRCHFTGEQVMIIILLF